MAAYSPSPRRVVVVAVDVDVDAPDRVHRLVEPREVDVDDVVDRDAEELLDRLEGLASGPAERVGGVELVDP